MRVCAACRPAALLVLAKRALLSMQTDKRGRRDLARLHWCLDVDLYICWDDECLYIAIRLICWVRHGRRVALLEVCAEYRGRHAAAFFAVVVAFLCRWATARPVPVVVLGASPQLEQQLAQRLAATGYQHPQMVKCFEDSISKWGLQGGFSVEGFLAHPTAYDHTPIVQRATALLAAAGLESRGPQPVSFEFARALYPAAAKASWADWFAHGCAALRGLGPLSQQ